MLQNGQKLDSCWWFGGMEPAASDSGFSGLSTYRRSSFATPAERLVRHRDLVSCCVETSCDSGSGVAVVVIDGKKSLWLVCGVVIAEPICVVLAPLPATTLSTGLPNHHHYAALKPYSWPSLEASN